MTALSKRLLGATGILGLLSTLATAEKRPLNLGVRHDGPVDVLPSQKGYLSTPGSVDLSNLTFSLYGKSGTNFTLEVAAFRQPHDCGPSHNYQCYPWTKLGVGRSYGYYGQDVRYCCDEYAAEQGFCSSEQMYHMIIDDEVFEGHYHSIDFAPGQHDTKHWEFGPLEFAEGKLVTPTSFCLPFVIGNMGAISESLAIPFGNPRTAICQSGCLDFGAFWRPWPLPTWHCWYIGGLA